MLIFADHIAVLVTQIYQQDQKLLFAKWTFILKRDLIIIKRDQGQKDLQMRQCCKCVGHKEWVNEWEHRDEA